MSNVSQYTGTVSNRFQSLADLQIVQNNLSITINEKRMYAKHKKNHRKGNAGIFNFRIEYSKRSVLQIYEIKQTCRND